MKIEKISKDNFTLEKEGKDYILQLGKISPSTVRPFTLRISEVINSREVVVEPKCGCTTNNNKIIDNNTIETTLSYNLCETNIAKTVVISDKKSNIKLKIKGTCSTQEL